MLILLLPVWLLALPVTWRRSANLPKSHRIGLLLFLTIGIVPLGQALTSWYVVSGLSWMDEPDAIRRVHWERNAMWVELCILAISVAAFVFVARRGLRTRQRKI